MSYDDLEEFEDALQDLFAIDDNPGGEVVILDACGRAWIIAPDIDQDVWFAQGAPREDEDEAQLGVHELAYPVRVLSPNGIHELAEQIAAYYGDQWPHSPACQGEPACPLCLILAATGGPAR